MNTFFDKLKNWYKSKTMWFAFVLVILSTIQLTFGLFVSLVSPQIYAWLTMLIAIAVATLRFVTDKPLDEK